MFGEYELMQYMIRVRRDKNIDKEIERVQKLLQEAEKYPILNKSAQRGNVAGITQIFRALLAEKARQKVIQEVCQNDTSSTQYGSTSPAHDPTRGIRAWDILKHKIAWS